MSISARITLLLAAGAALAGCGRLGYEAVDRDASLPGTVDAAPDADTTMIADATADAPVTPAADAPAADAPAVPPPDAMVAGACNLPADCGATRACVSHMCVAAQRVFVSAVTTSSAAFGGLGAGDALCQGYADSAQLGGTWKAWLSSGTQHAQNRLTQSALPYRRLDGALVASDWTGLINGTLMNPIDVDEHLGPVPGAEVWTGTSAFGMKTMATCSDWTNGTNTGTVATVGLSSATDTTWSEVYLQFCDRSNVHLYCVEQ